MVDVTSTGDCEGSHSVTAESKPSLGVLIYHLKPLFRSTVT